MNNVIDDSPKEDHIHYGWPAVEVNKNGDMVIVYARTGTSIWPQVRFSAYYHNEPDIRPSRLLKDGENHYGQPTDLDKDGKPEIFRWGDTAGASVDPVEDHDVWSAQQYAAKNNRYGIWVGKVTP